MQLGEVVADRVDTAATAQTHQAQALRRIGQHDSSGRSPGVPLLRAVRFRVSLRLATQPRVVQSSSRPWLSKTARTSTAGSLLATLVSATNASKTRAGELMVSRRPGSGEVQAKPWGAPRGMTRISPGPNE